MTGYSTEDLNGWEFKIIRSAFGAFRNPDKVRRLLEEESRAGWELLEKFDDQRIRLKRKVEKRKNDSTLGYDAYRTSYGTPEYAIAVVVLGAIAIGVLVALLAARH